MRVFNPAKPTRARALLTLRYAKKHETDGAIVTAAVVHLAKSGSACTRVSRRLRKWGFDATETATLCDAGWPQFAAPPAP